MKKILSLTLGLITLFLTSCTDDSGEFGKRFYTTSNIENAIGKAIEMSVDTANARLSIPESNTLGFYHYLKGEYRIALPTLLSPIFEIEANQMYQDSLTIAFNEVAERCGSNMASYVESATETMVINDPDTLLYGANDAFTNHFYNSSYFGFINAIHQAVQVHALAVQIDGMSVKALYEQLLTNYYQADGAPINLDIYQEIAEQMGTAMIAEMKKEEEKIRTDIAHRGAETGIVYQVFLNYDVK